MTIYSVSDAYKTAIRARTRTDRVRGTLTLTNGTVLNLDAADLMSGSLTLDNQCVTGEELAFGCAYLGQAALNLRTDLSRHAFYGAKLVLHYGLQLPGGRWETVPLGVYTVAEAERRALYVSIKAYDNILALQQKYDGTTMQGTAYALLGQIAAACGLTLGQTEAEISALNPNAALVCQLSGADGLSTWRECAAAVAQLVGGFAATDRAGRAAKKLSTVGFDTLQKLTVAAASGTDAATDEIEGAEVGGGGVLTGADEGGAVEGYGALEAVLRRVKGLFEAIEPVVSRVRESIGRLGELLSGKMSFAEYFGNLTPVETVLWSIAAAAAAIAAVRVIGAVADLGRLVAQLPLWLQLASVWRLCHGEGWRLSSAMASVFGRTTQLFAGIGSLVGGAVLAVSNAFVMWRSGFSWLHETLMVLGVAIAAVGAVILGVPATVAAAVAGAVAAVATAVVLIHQHWDEVKSGALATLGQIKQGFSDTLEGIKQIFGGWWQVFVGLATGNVRKLGEGIKNIVKGVVNVVIGTINLLIAGLNATVAPIRALIVGIGRVTGKHYTLDSVRIPSIPRLATGAVMEANRPFAAILGDQTSGRNIETPERLLRQIYREESRGASSETVELLGELLRAVRAGKVLTVDRRVLAEVTARTMAERARGSGTEPVPIR